jgi:hypothetical protein
MIPKSCKSSIEVGFSILSGEVQQHTSHAHVHEGAWMLKILMYAFVWGLKSKSCTGSFLNRKGIERGDGATECRDIGHSVRG